jgi:hypothetical protein
VHARILLYTEVNLKEKRGLSFAGFALPFHNRPMIYSNTISLKELRIAEYHPSNCKTPFRIPMQPV